MRCYFTQSYPSKDTSEKAEIIRELISRRIIFTNSFDVEEYELGLSYKLARNILMKHLREVGKADMFLLYIPTNAPFSSGCGIEMFHAWQLKKFIQVISNRRHPEIAYILDSRGNQFFTSINDWVKQRQAVWK